MENEMPTEREAFISYARDDGLEFATHVRDVLEKIGISCFMDKRDIEIGVKWEKKINKAIEHCTYLIAILTPKACKSEYVNIEISTAKAARKDIKPCVPSSLSKHKLPGVLEGIQCLFFVDKKTLARKLVLSIYKSEIVHPSGIKRVFKDRRHEYELVEKEMRKHIMRSKKVLMLGISLRDFFGEKVNPQYNAIYADIIADALEKGVQFDVLLLDPTSEAAKDRAIIENGPSVEDDEKYKKCELFQDIQRVANWLYGPPSALEGRIRRLMEVRFYDITPSMFAIITRDSMFIEQYHMGRLEVLPEGEIEDKQICVGGYVPFLMVETNSNFAKLITDHFNNVWKKMKHNTLKDTIENLDKFTKITVAFRTKQFLDSFLKKENDLRPLLKRSLQHKT
jgi:hypothetical protein